MPDPKKQPRDPAAASSHYVEHPTAEFDTRSAELHVEPETLDSRRASDSTISQPKGKLGNYHIIDEVARGGMGIVYRVKQQGTDRIVALKLIRGAAPSPKEVERFQAEARAAANLDHPGIVPIYDVDFIAGSPFFTMKYIAGPSLSTRLSGTPLDPVAAAKLTHDVADAIEHAHESGIIHRDLKPGNILLENDLRPMVTDFGLAKLTSSDSELTRTGEAIGTPAYMPPEQAAGDRQNIDRRSDVYSVGAVLYACLTGRPPFQGASAMATIVQVTRDEPLSPRSLNPEVPLDLEVICLKCLEKAPGKRYQTAKHLRDELARYLSGQPIHARAATTLEKAWKWTSRNRLATAAIAAAVVALAGLSLAAGLTAELGRTKIAQAEASREGKRAKDALAIAEQANNRRAQAEYYGQIALAQLAYQQDDIMSFSGLLFGTEPAFRDWEFSYLRNLYDAPERLHTEAKGVTHSANLSPDGRTLALAPAKGQVSFVDLDTRKTLWSVPLGDGHYEMVQAVVASDFDEMLAVENQGGKTVSHRISHFRLSQSDRTAELVSSVETIPGVSVVANWEKRVAILQADARAGVPTNDHQLRLLPLDGQMKEITVTSPVSPQACIFSPDGEWLYVAGYSDNGVDGLLCKFETDTWTVVKQAVIQASGAMRLAVGPKANLLAVSAERQVATYSTESLAVASRAQPIQSRVLGIDFTSDQSKLAVSTYSGRVDVLNTDDLTISNTLRGQSWPAFKALFPHATNEVLSVAQNGEVLRWQTHASANQLPIAVHDARVKSIAISSDDSLVASCGVVANGGPGVMLTDVQSGEQLTNVLSPDEAIQKQLGNVSWLQFTDDGSTLVVATYDYSLKFLDVRTGKLTRILNLADELGLWDAALSKDQRWLATAGLDNTARRFDLTSGEMTHHYKEADAGFWSVEISEDGTELYCTGTNPENLFVFSIGQFDQPTIHRSLTDAPRAGTFIPSRHQIVFGGIAGHMASINLQTKISIEPSLSETKLINAIEAHPSGNRLVTCSDQGTVTLRETTSLAQVMTLTGHRAAVTAATFSPSGKYLVTGDAEGKLIIWDAR